MKKEKTWFAHDYFDADEPAIAALCTQYKMEGYGRLWRLIELLRVANGYKFNIQKPFAYNTLATRMMTTEVKARKFITDLLETYKLLQTDGEYIWSDWLMERMMTLDKKTAMLSERGKKGAEVTNAKKSAQAKLRNANNTAQANENTAHNITLQNITEHNTTTTEQNTACAEEKNTTIAAAVNTGSEKQVKNLAVRGSSSTGGGQGYVYSWEQQKQAALADTARFVYPHVSGRHITEARLAQWLDAFNRSLEYRKEPPKSEQDYRQHFANWFKFHNTQREDPEEIGAVPLPLPPRQQDSPMPYLKTAAEALADQAHHMENAVKRMRIQKNQIAQTPQTPQTPKGALGQSNG